MSTLWTPGGERPIRREPAPGSTQPGPAGGGPGSAGGGPGSAGGGPGSPGGAGPEQFSEEEARARLAEIQDQLAKTPVEVVIANHAFGLFELAALHLSLDPPQLEQARLAIDALAALVEGLGDRLGEPATELGTGLAQLRMAFVQIHAARQSGASSAGGPGG
jgi:hypothetical protein